MPKWLNVIGIILCITLAISFGWETFAISTGILALALAARWLWQRRPNL